jgi:hypothetical protein
VPRPRRVREEPVPATWLRVTIGASLNVSRPSGRVQLAVIILTGLLCACSAPAADTTSTSATPSPSASGTGAPASGYRVLFTASTPSATEIFLYDSGSSTPQQLVSLSSASPPEPRFISAQKIAYVDNPNTGPAKIISLELGTRAPSTEVTVNGYVPAFAYSHDGSRLAYLVHDTSGSGKASLHLRRGAQETTLSLNTVPGRGVGRDDEVRLEFAPDDTYLLMVDTYVGNQGQAPETGQFLVLRSADNSVGFVPPSGISSNATMATWARHKDRLYYRDAVGVRTWDAGATSVGTMATALHWYDPAPAADDRWLAFTEIDNTAAPHVRLYDLQSNQVVATGTAPRSHPIFITGDTLWYLEEQPCVSECLGGPSQTSGKVLAYSLKTRSETALPFTDVHSLSQLSVAPS